jgi:hypothetical protein
MSSQPRQNTGLASRPLSCTFCDCHLTEQLLALQSYPSESTSLPATVPDHGGLTLCPDCSSEVVALLTSWQDHPQPPVSSHLSIGEGYQEVASTCSFCSGDCASGVLGVELYRRVDDDVPAYANYSLCRDCQSVFGEFLGNVREAEN